MRIVRTLVGPINIGRIPCLPTRSGSDTLRIRPLDPSTPAWASSLVMRDVMLAESGPLSSCYPNPMCQPDLIHRLIELNSFSEPEIQEQS